MTERRYQLAFTDPLLGRHVNHDERSKDYPAETAAYRSVRWSHHGAVLDQGRVGACTGFAGVDVVNTEPLWYEQTESTPALGLKLYGAATQIDPYPGSYPPDDTGSDGLSVAKVMKGWGWITSYTHAFGLDHAVGALMLGPLMTGTVWLEGMFDPDSDGRVHPRGDVAGGHEYVVYGVEIARTPLAHRVSHARSKVWCLNSWGGDWGQSGCFYYTFGDYGELLAEDGDVTVPVR